MWICSLHKEAMIVGTLTKVTMLQRKQMGGISEEQLLFHPNEGVPEESAYVQLQMRGCVALMTTDGYKYILGFSLSMMPSSTTTHCNDDNI